MKVQHPARHQWGLPGALPVCTALLLSHADPKEQAEGCLCLTPHTNTASSICPDCANTLTGASGTVMSQAEGTHCPWSAEGGAQLQRWVPSTGLLPPISTHLLSHSVQCFGCATTALLITPLYSYQQVRRILNAVMLSLTARIRFQMCTHSWRSLESKWGSYNPYSSEL